MLGRLWALLAFVLLSANASAQDKLTSESRRMIAIQSMGLPSFAGRLTTFYSPDTPVARVKYLQSLFDGEIQYYSKFFHTQFAPIDMAVLSPNQWSRVAGADPYGMPSVDGTKPYVFVMPASWDSVSFMPFPKRTNVPPDILKEALNGHRTWDQIKYEGADGIGTHEIGHAIIYQLGIDAQTHWFNELLASYVGYAYLKAKHPQEALSSEIFWTQGLDAPHPFTKLDDFENRYDELQQKYPANYGWYQLAFDQRVIEVYRSQGTGFLRAVRAAFLKNSPKLNTEQVLEKLERLHPGWKAWSNLVETGRIEAVGLRGRIK